MVILTLAAVAGGAMLLLGGAVALAQEQPPTLETLQTDYREPVAAEPEVPAWALGGAGFPVERPEFGMSVGYANLDLDGSSVISNESALRVEGWLAFSPLREQLPQLRLGADVGVSMVLDNSSRTIISNDGNLIFRGTSDIPFWLIEPELRASWRQTFGDAGQFFIEPGVAGGMAFGFLQLDAEDGSEESFDENDSTLYGRAFLRAGAAVTGGIAGVEISWLAAEDEMDFGDNASGKLGEWYVGFFGALLF